MGENQIVYVFLGFAACWFGSAILLLWLLSREMREWVVGPEYFEILGACIMFCPPVGIWDLLRARKMNREKTFPNAIISVWFKEEG